MDRETTLSALFDPPCEARDVAVGDGAFVATARDDLDRR
jgi:hypothetical protein